MKLWLEIYESYKNIKAIFRIFTEIAVSTIEIERCGIWILEENGDKLRCMDLFSSSTSQHISDIMFSSRTNPEIFKTLKSVTDRLCDGLLHLSNHTDTVKSIAGWHWILTDVLKTN